MKSDRTTAVVVGALFIVATVASIFGSVALGSVLDAPDYLIGFAGHESSVILAVLLFLIAATSAFGTALLLFPILRRHAEGLAAGYAGLRAFENVFYIAGAVSLLVMLTVSKSAASGAADASDLSLLGATLQAFHAWSVGIGTLLFAGLGSLTLNTVLYQSRLVPRWLSGWGLVGAAGLVVYGVVGILGLPTDLGSPYMALAMPIALQEMVFAGWLIAKGFKQREVLLDQAHEPRVDVMA
jgi:hypothetical protein